MKKIKKEDIEELELAIEEMQASMLREEKLRKGVRDAVPGLDSWPTLDNNNSPYDAYRFGITMAGAPDIPTGESQATGGDFLTIAYTDGDEKILKSAAKQMGVSSSTIASKKSKELDDIHRTSPVAKIKRNRYGI